jgi:hypothetical protein
METSRPQTHFSGNSTRKPPRPGPHKYSHSAETSKCPATFPLLLIDHSTFDSFWPFVTASAQISKIFSTVIRALLIPRICFDAQFETAEESPSRNQTTRALSHSTGTHPQSAVLRLRRAQRTILLFRSSAVEFHLELSQVISITRFSVYSRPLQ